MGGDLAAFLHAWLAGADSDSLRDRVCHCLYGDDGEAGKESSLPRELSHGASLALMLVIGLLSGACLKAPLPGRGQATQ